MEHVEEILDFSDWASIPIESHFVSLERLKQVLITATEERGTKALGTTIIE